MTTNIREIVLAAFQAEHKEQLEGIRAALAGVEQSQFLPNQGCLDEAFRLAHSLKGGARVCDLRVAETFGHRLETLFSQVREGTMVLDHPVLNTINQVLDAIEDWMAALTQDETAPDTSAALNAIDNLLGITVTEEPAASAPETTSEKAPRRTRCRPADIRVEEDGNGARAGSESGSLARLSQGASQRKRLPRPGDMRGGRTSVPGDPQMERERESLRRAATSSLHSLTVMPEFGRVAKYLESFDLQIRQLSKSASQLCLKQRRCAWRLRERSRQIQREARDARMVAAGSIFQGFRKMVRDLAKDAGKQVHFRADGFDVPADRLVLQTLKDPLMHALRNCISHGIETPDVRIQNGKPAEGQVALKIETESNRLRIIVEDDGRGVDVTAVAETAIRRGILTESQAAAQSPEELLKLVFQAGFSTSGAVTELAGRGMGLSVVHEAVKSLQADAQIESKPGAGSRVTITAPLSVASHRLLLVACGGQTFGIPTRSIVRLLRLDAGKIEKVEGQSIAWFEGQPVPLHELSELLDIGGQPTADRKILPVAIVEAAGKRLAIGVEAFLAAREAFVQSLTGPAARKEFAGAMVLENGTVGLVLNPLELLKAPRRARPEVHRQNAAVAPTLRTPRILVVDDSFTTRALEKGILEAHGYQVGIAVDGVDALSKLCCDVFDLVISDIEMPRMNGFEMLEDLRKDVRFASLPVVLVTSRDRLEDRRRGLELGAEAYIVKRQFDHQELLATIRQVVGDPTHEVA